jgi:hypothetical protein
MSTKLREQVGKNNSSAQLSDAAVSCRYVFKYHIDFLSLSLSFLSGIRWITMTLNIKALQRRRRSIFRPEPHSFISFFLFHFF